MKCKETKDGFIYCMQVLVSLFDISRVISSMVRGTRFLCEKKERYREWFLCVSPPFYRSTLSSLPIYFLSFLHFSRWVKLRLDQIHRDFLWGEGTLDKKPYIVNFYCLRRYKGRGLGVRCLSKLNRALLCKWSWRFAHEREGLWRNVIRWKFGEERGGWVSGDGRGVYGTDIWKEIRKKWETLFSNVVLSLGNGRRVRFWKDIWCREEAFPSLFALASNKEALVVDLWEYLREDGGWSPCFTKPFND